MYCKHCGKEIADDSKFCQHCGCRLDKKNVSSFFSLFNELSAKRKKLKRLDAVIDRLNKINGSETVVIASQQYTKTGGKGKADVFANAMKQEHKSKNPTTTGGVILLN